jgi:hypothetical protein
MPAWDDRGKAEGSKETQIKPGEKRSKAGRPKGSKNKKTLIEAAVQTALVNELEADAMEIYHKAAEMAKDGDKTMIKLFLQRLLPELKAEGGADSKNQVGGIQIVVNQTDNSPKDVSEAVTINQIENTEQEEDDSDG